jgi:membrane dipeptidase
MPRDYPPFSGTFGACAPAALVTSILATLACHAPAPVAPTAPSLHFDAIVVDTHNDITTAILDDGFDLGTDGAAPDAKLKTHTDLARMRRGGLDAEFFSIYVASSFIGKSAADGGGPARRALDMIDAVYRQIARHPDALELATTADDIERIARSGPRPKIAALMGIEGGHAIEDSLGALRMFYRLGVRYMTLTHSSTNDWADSSGDADNPLVAHHHGLTAFGEAVVLEMNRLGMMVDISHVSDETFWAVVRVTRAPVIASHSSVRSIAPHPRNLTDDMLRALGKNGGVVMVNFFDAFLDARAGADLEASSALQRLVRLFYPWDYARIDRSVESWITRNQKKERVPLARLVEHIEHAVRVAGIDHVGLGSDFDGLPTLDSTPAGMDDVAALPALTAELVRRGHSDEDIRKILGKNLLRVMREVEAVARAAQP